MPRYEFVCKSCEKGFEVMSKCPSCGSEKVTPQLTVFTAKTLRKS